METGSIGGKKSNFGQQADTAPKEIIKEVEKIVTQTVKELIEVEKIIEKPDEVIRVVEVEKIIEKPVEKIVIKEVEVEKEVFIEKIK